MLSHHPFIPKDYAKPRIEIGNYFLKWDDDNKSQGIHSRGQLYIRTYIEEKNIQLFSQKKLIMRTSE
jgi:hypothetical protein